MDIPVRKNWKCIRKILKNLVCHPKIQNISTKIERVERTEGDNARIDLTPRARLQTNFVTILALYYLGIKIYWT
jgi:hypothetical protein